MPMLVQKMYWSARESTAALRRGMERRAFARREYQRATLSVVGTAAEHARATAAWLARAQDAAGDGGVSQCYFPIPGRWAAAYPETSGYVVGSLLRFSDLFSAPEYRERARRITDWLVDVQLPCGGIQAGTLVEREPSPTIFNTGQVVHGWMDAWSRWRDERYARAALRACRWLRQMQDDDGCWRRGGSPRVPRTSENVYNVRTAWAMIRVGQTLDEPDFIVAAERNFAWAATQESAGWFDRNDFSDCERPILHTIAYAAESFLEAGFLLNRQAYIDLAMRACDGVFQAQRPDGHIPGRLDRQFRAAARWVCLTGDAQMLLVARRVAKVFGETRYEDAAARLSQALRSRQALHHELSGVEGGLAGSHPVSGAYMSYCYPNWAAKFFLDAMLEEAAVKMPQ